MCVKCGVYKRKGISEKRYIREAMYQRWDMRVAEEVCIREGVPEEVYIRVEVFQKRDGISEER